MKRYILRALALIICAVTVVGTLVSCSKEPYPYELDEYIIMPEDFSLITVTKAEIDTAIRERISAMLKNSAVEQPVMNRGAGIGDILNLSLVCYKLDTYTEDRLEGKYIGAITDNDCTVRIGDGKYPQELENALIGKAAGDSFNVHAKLPDTYTVDSLGATNVVYECVVKSVKESVLPAYNDEFVKSVSEYQTVLEYEESLRKPVIEELAFGKLLEQCSFKAYPIEEVNRHTSNFISYYTDLASSSQITLEQYVAKKLFIELSEFHLEADAYAKQMVKSELLLYSLVRKYELEVTNEEYTAGARMYAAKYGLESVSALESKFGIDYVTQTVQMDKVMAFLAERVTVEDGNSPA